MLTLPQTRNFGLVLQFDPSSITTCETVRALKMLILERYKRFYKLFVKMKLHYIFFNLSSVTTSTTPCEQLNDASSRKKLTVFMNINQFLFEVYTVESVT